MWSNKLYNRPLNARAIFVEHSPWRKNALGKKLDTKLMSDTSNTEFLNEFERRHHEQTVKCIMKKFYYSFFIKLYLSYCILTRMILIITTGFRENAQKIFVLLF